MKLNFDVVTFLRERTFYKQLIEEIFIRVMKNRVELLQLNIMNNTSLD